MKAFDNSEYLQHKAEAKEKWGATDAYRQHEEKTKDYSKQKWDDLAGKMDDIMVEFALLMKNGMSPDSTEARQQVQALQNHITSHYYRCTDQILAGLGQMYVTDERFRQNIDLHGDGTAAFICEAIGAYCKK
jgi:hypothetical protein